MRGKGKDEIGLFLVQQFQRIAVGGTSQRGCRAAGKLQIGVAHGDHLKTVAGHRAQIQRHMPVADPDKGQLDILDTFHIQFLQKLRPDYSARLCR